MQRILIAASSVLLVFLSSLPARLGARGFNTVAVNPRHPVKSPSIPDDPGPQAANAVPGEVTLKLKSNASMLRANRGDILGTATRLVAKVCGENSTERIRPLSTQP